MSERPLDLLLKPRRGVAPAALCKALREAFERRPPNSPPGPAGDGRFAYDEGHVVVELTLETLVRCALPLTPWWHKMPGQLADLTAPQIESLLRTEEDPPLSNAPPCPELPPVRASGIWLLRLLGTLLWAREQNDRNVVDPGRLQPRDFSDQLEALLRGLPKAPSRQSAEGALLWSINRNRGAFVAVWNSAKTIKADAATRLFTLDCSHLCWAVLDTGIDATHPAFRQRTKTGKLKRRASATAAVSRVVETHDFTGIRELLSDCTEELAEEVLGGAVRNPRAELGRRLSAGQAIDWELLQPLLRIEHDADYKPPVHAHGTHVAGTLAEDWGPQDDGYGAHESHAMRGVCPGLRLYDLRVLDGEGRPVPYEIDGLWLNSFDDVVGSRSQGSVAALRAAVHSGSLPSEQRHSAATIQSVGQGRSLRDRAELLALEVNGGDDLITDGWIWSMGDGLTLQILGPRQIRIDEFQEAWDKEVRRRGWAASVDGAEVAAFLDRSPFNLASTVVLAKLGRRTMLLTGDARGDDVLEGLREGGILTGGSCRVDVLKVPHHGSDRNVSTEFFRAVKAKHYVISGNGKHDNPDITTLRMIVEARGNASYKVHCTYRNGIEGLQGRLTTFLNSLPSRQRRKFRFRSEDELGFKIDLRARIRD